MVLHGIFRSLNSAKNFRKTLAPILGCTLQTKIVHPNQFVVKTFVAAGNEIKL
jgi:hypothetical protein